MIHCLLKLVKFSLPPFVLFHIDVDIIFLVIRTPLMTKQSCVKTQSSTTSELKHLVVDNLPTQKKRKEKKVLCFNDCLIFDFVMHKGVPII